MENIKRKAGYGMKNYAVYKNGVYETTIPFESREAAESAYPLKNGWVVKPKAGRPKLPEDQKSRPVALRLRPDLELIYNQVGRGRWVVRMLERIAKEAAL